MSIIDSEHFESKKEIIPQTETKQGSERERDFAKVIRSVCRKLNFLYLP